MEMRDYPEGAFEALSWVKQLFEEQNTRCQGCQSVLEKVERMLSRIQRGAAVDFSMKIESN